MSESLYYVKVRGRTLGPLDTQRIRQLIQQGQVSRTNPMSTDNQDWKKASDFAELFQFRAAESRSSSAMSSASSGGGTATGSASAADPSGVFPPPDAATSGWYYSVGDSHQGPVAESVLRDLIQFGRLRSDELVWREGMTDWQPVMRMREFASLFPSQPTQRQPAVEQVRVENNSHDFLETKNILGNSAGWVTFVCVMGYLFSGLMLFGSIALLIGAFAVNSRIAIVQAMLSFFSPLALIGVTVYVNLYLLSANRFRITSRIEDLNTTFRWLARIWFVLSIFSFLCLLIVIALVIIALVTGATAADIYSAA